MRKRKSVLHLDAESLARLHGLTAQLRAETRGDVSAEDVMRRLIHQATIASPPQKGTQPEPPPAPDSERQWVTRTYRLPPATVRKLQELIGMYALVTGETCSANDLLNRILCALHDRLRDLASAPAAPAK